MLLLIPITLSTNQKLIVDYGQLTKEIYKEIFSWGRLFFGFWLVNKYWVPKQQSKKESEYIAFYNSLIENIINIRQNIKELVVETGKNKNTVIQSNKKFKDVLKRFYKHYSKVNYSLDFFEKELLSELVDTNKWEEILEFRSLIFPSYIKFHNEIYRGEIINGKRLSEELIFHFEVINNYEIPKISK
jgi:hypothetical protein